MSQIETDAEDEPIKKLVRLILFRGLDQGASDIHIEPFEKLIRIRYRVNGDLAEGSAPPRKLYPALLTRLKVLSDCRIDENRLPQCGRACVRYAGRDVDILLFFFPCIYGERVVMRILDQGGVPLDLDMPRFEPQPMPVLQDAQEIPPGPVFRSLDQGSMALDLDMLGYEPQPMSAFRDALEMPQGLMLITGPPGNGKTTTLYSAFHKLNQVGTSIVTVEDPVEYEMFGIVQTQVRESIGLRFAEALRQLLFQDPDVIMVGEIQDGETASLAVKAALTGHLVLSALHTDDAAGVFQHLIDMGVEPFQVQSSVLLAASQRLLKRVCAHCKQPVEVPEDVLERIQYKPFDYIEKPTFVRTIGCAKCWETGYKGYVAIVEAMLNWPELQPLVLQNRSSHEIKEMAVKCGMKTLRQNALAKAAKGLTTLEQMLEHTVPD